MSFEAMAWAVKQDVSNSGQKLVLIMLADYTNSDTGQCNPSHQRLADKCCMGLSTLKRHIDDLAEYGFLTKVPVFVDSIRRPNQYILHIPTSPNRADPLPKSGTPPAQIGLQNQEVKPVNKPERVNNEITLPAWVPLDAWNGFLDMRKAIKKPPTDYAIKLLINKLYKLKSAGHNIEEIIEASIASSWQDFYEPKATTFKGVDINELNRRRLA